MHFVWLKTLFLKKHLNALKCVWIQLACLISWRYSLKLLYDLSGSFSDANMNTKWSHLVGLFIFHRISLLFCYLLWYVLMRDCSEFISMLKMERRQKEIEVLPLLCHLYVGYDSHLQFSFFNNLQICPNCQILERNVAADVLKLWLTVFIVTGFHLMIFEAGAVLPYACCLQRSPSSWLHFIWCCIWPLGRRYISGSASDDSALCTQFFPEPWSFVGSFSPF